MTTNNNTNSISITQAVQFENGKHIFSIFYAPGLFANTPWTLYRNNCYRALNFPIKEVVRKAEENGWVVFNYTDLPDSEIWFPEVNPVDILNDYHLTGMKTLEIAMKYGITRDEVMMWLEKEANGEVDNLFFKQ